MKNKKVTISIISVVTLLLVLIGVTYAYWLVTKSQTNSNIISSACLDITMDNEVNDINLSSQYPLSKEEGMKLTPYTFTVTNNCNTSIDYQIALESIGSEEGAISASALQVALDTNSDLLSNKATTAPTVNGAYASHKIGYGTLTASGNEGSSVTHDLRIWIDENAPISEMNKTYQSKITVTIGQGIKGSAIKPGTLAYNLLANYGGEDAILEINNHELTDRAYKTDYLSTTPYEQNWYGTEYSYDEETGKYILTGTLVEAHLDDCQRVPNLCGKYTFLSSSADYSGSVIYEIIDFGTEYKVKGNFIKRTNGYQDIEVDGLFKLSDDIGDSYYLKGDVSNNYVKFGSYPAGTELTYAYNTYSFEHYEVADDGVIIDVGDWVGYWGEEPILSLKECKQMAAAEPYDSHCMVYEQLVATKTVEEETPMYWRIVRVNGDGTIRLVYDGTTKVANDVDHISNVGFIWFNEIYDDLKYVGYTYLDDDQNSIDSSIKLYLENWYRNNLKTTYGKYIADGIFCNDKEITKKYYSWDDEAGYVESTKDNFDFLKYSFGSKNRLYNGIPSPNLICARADDKYSVNTDIGNGLLNEPVGLLTADEAFLAINANHYKEQYLLTGDVFWTMSPFQYDDGGLSVYGVYSDGMITSWPVDLENSIRPVINLRADVLFEGNGSFETPYVIKTQ